MIINLEYKRELTQTLTWTDKPSLCDLCRKIWTSETKQAWVPAGARCPHSCCTRYRPPVLGGDIIASNLSSWWRLRQQRMSEVLIFSLQEIARQVSRWIMWEKRSFKNILTLWHRGCRSFTRTWCGACMWGDRSWTILSLWPRLRMSLYQQNCYLEQRHC